MIAADDVIGLLSAAVLFGLAVGCWSGWQVGYCAGQSSVADDLTEALADTHTDQQCRDGASA